MSEMALFWPKQKNTNIWHSTSRINEFHERSAKCTEPWSTQLPYSILHNGMKRNGIDAIYDKLNYILAQINNDNYELCCRWYSCRNLLWHSHLAYVYGIWIYMHKNKYCNARKKIIFNQNKDKWMRWAHQRNEQTLLVCEINGKWKAMCSFYMCSVLHKNLTNWIWNMVWYSSTA